MLKQGISKIFNRKPVATKSETKNKLDNVDLRKNEFYILLNSLIYAGNLVAKCSKYSENITLSNGIYTVNAKSLLCILSLDLTKWLTIKIHTDNENIIKKFNIDMMAFRKEDAEIVVQ